MLACESLFNQALDSQKKAYELAKQIFKEDSYELQECMVNLAEAFEKAGETDAAASLFQEFFKALDGRSELAGNTTMSIKSRLSRGLSIRTKSNASVAYKKFNSPYLSLDNSREKSQNPSAI